MAVHGYGRASTNKQKESPDVQKATMTAYAKLHGLAEPLWYIDPATSGKVPLREREAGGVLYKSLKPGDHVIIAKLDRAFRRLGDCCDVLEDFKRRNIRLHICNLMGGAIDLSSPIGEFLIKMLAAFAELERAFIAERTSDAMKARRRRGLGGGRPRYGFTHETRYRTVDGEREAYKVEVPDPEERRIMRMCLAWRTEDPPRSFDRIRETLNYDLKLRTRDGREFSIERIRRMIKAEAILQYKEVTDGRRHEPSR